MNRIFVLFRASLGHLFDSDAWVLGNLYEFCPDVAIILLVFPDFTPIFYGMKRARVGAFTDFGGSRYRNPVHFLGYFLNFTLILEFSGLVYYTGGFPGCGPRIWA